MEESDETKKQKMKRRRKVSSKRRKRRKDNHQFRQYLEFMNSNISDHTPKTTSSHPLLYVGDKIFTLWKENTLILKKAEKYVDGKNHRIIHYEISYTGKNLRVMENSDGKKYINLKKTKKGCFL